MKTRKAAVAAPMQSKDTKELRLPQLKSMVLQMMKEGQRFTAKEINRIAGFRCPENSFPTFDAIYPIIWFGIPD